jgi:hypothetical protein
MQTLRKLKDCGRSFAAAATTTLLLTAGLLVAGAGPAQADPSHCSTAILDFRTTSARCSTGSGTYRAVVVCSHYGTVVTYTRTGNTVRVGQTSKAYCPRGLEEAIEARVQIVSLR